MDALGIERANVVGHDWGDFAGYAACLSQPDRIERFMPRGGVTLWSASGAPIGLWLRPWIVLSIQMQRRNAEARASVVTARPKLPPNCDRRRVALTRSALTPRTHESGRPGSNRATSSLGSFLGPCGARVSRRR